MPNGIHDFNFSASESYDFIALDFEPKLVQGVDFVNFPADGWEGMLLS